MDYSENVSQHFKYEPQSSHFNKTQYSLHCTVKHVPGDSPYQYIYHLSDEKKHNHAFTSAVIDHILSDELDENMIRVKSDNCSTQYKCKWVFGFYHNLEIEKQVKILVCYGVSGHGKGLVDAMSSFSVNAPLLRAVITNDFFYNRAEDIYNYLVDHFAKDDNKHYFLLSPDTIASKRLSENPLKITDCMKLHNCFFPDGSIQTKVNICSCNFCLQGDFISCTTEKGNIFQHSTTEASDDESDDSDDNEEYGDDDDDDKSGHKLYKLRAESVTSIMSKDSTITLYSSANALELFYLCKVLDFGEATELLKDKNKNVIEKGSKFIKCQYYQKIKKKE